MSLEDSLLDRHEQDNTPYDPSQDTEPIVKEAPLHTPNKSKGSSSASPLPSDTTSNARSALATSAGNQTEDLKRKPENVVTIFDVASEIENMLNDLSKQIEDSEKQMYEKIEKINKKLDKISKEAVPVRR